MDKILDYPGKTERGIHTFLIGEEQNYLIKTASEYHPTISAYIRNAKKIPGMTQLLITALGAGEWWGDNTNSDFFGEDQLAHDGADYGFKTFELNARLYKHHINKPTSQHYGQVLLAVYNPVYHRVELIIGVDHSLAPDIIANIENGIYPVYSMGCKIPYDICSICGNKAPNRKYYCEHLRYKLGTIDLRTGRKVYAINIRPKFFDISIVVVPADKTAMTLRKVAFSVPQGILDANGRVVSSAEKAEKVATLSKVSTMEKEITSAPPASEDIIDTDKLVNNEAVRNAVQGIIETKSLERRIPNHLIDRMCSIATMPEILSTMLSCAIMPKPQEFQRIFLISRGARTFADKLDNANACFDPRVEHYDAEHPKFVNELGIEEGNVRGDLAELLQPYFSDRSCAAPFLLKRMTLMVKEGYEKTLPPSYIAQPTPAESQNSMLKTLAIGSALYTALNLIGSKKPTIVQKLMLENPLVTAATGLGIYAALYSPPGREMNTYRGRFTDTSSVIYDSSNTYDRIDEMRDRPYIKVGEHMSGRYSAAARRLLVGLPAVHFAAGRLQRHKEMHPGEEQGMVTKFITDHPNLAKSIVVADALLATKGKGSYVITHPMYDAQAKWFKGEPMFKAAGIVESEDTYPKAKPASSAMNYATSALVWPLVTGAGNLPGRVVGSLFDQAVLSAGSKLVDKYKQRRNAQVVKGVSYANPSRNP